VIIKVHQALHGYSDGHRQLACSAKLSALDAKLILLMSDVSGPGVASEGSSYLTGYPLVEGAVYALARTWSAPEMPRPGCVWTHTLLIDYPDLAALGTPSRLSKLFARPDSPSWPTYGMPGVLEIAAEDEPELCMSVPEEDWLAAVMNGLYDSSGKRVVARRYPELPVDALTLRIWDQQWPRLRRSFRFCTFTTKDRSTPGAAFDLQVLPGNDLSSRARLPNTLEVSPVPNQSQPQWLITLMDDARQPSVGGLRDTLRKLGADILGGREAMPVFCEFHRITSGSLSPAELQDAIKMVNEPGLLCTSDLARAKIAEYVLSNVEDADSMALDFLWDHWPQIGQAHIQPHLPQVSARLWQFKQQRLLTALRDSADQMASIAAQVFQAVPIDELLAGWPEHDVPLREMLESRPDLLKLPAFWSVVDIRSSQELHGSQMQMTGSVVIAMIRGMWHEPAMRAAVQLLGRSKILHVVQHLSAVNESIGTELRWVLYCVDDVSAVAEFLSQVDTPAVPLLLEIADKMPPDSVPNQYGEDPWVTTLARLKNSRGSLPLRLAAYGFARALGWTSWSVAELLQMTFEQLHFEALNSTLPDADWQLIEKRLPWVSIDRRWDRAARLRGVVAGVFIERRLRAHAFAWITSDNDVFVELMKETVGRWGGKWFLKSVEESLEQEHDALSKARRELIHSFCSRR
jgi:hypothetical protein